MKKSIPFLLQGKNIILVINGQSHTISQDTHISYFKIVEALKSQNWDALCDLVEPKKAIVNSSNGYVSFDGDKILWKGQPLHNALTRRIIEMFREGFPIEPMVCFMENLMQNPSKNSVEQLYTFLEKNSLPITEDGHFLAYKKVKKNYTDYHTGKINNQIGQRPKMDRNQVDDNPNSYCSDGLHFCSVEYLNSFGEGDDPVMILKINPADVVSIPGDYNGAKGRCCCYEVVAEVSGNPTNAFSSIVDTDYVKTVKKDKWPFDSDDLDHQPEDEMYDLVRMYGVGRIEYSNLTLDEARIQLAKNISQKKAKLKIVRAGTNEEVK